MRILLIILMLCLGGGSWNGGPARAQDFDPGFGGNLDMKPTDVIHWQAVGAERTGNRIIEVGLRLQTSQNFHIYEKRTKFAPPDGFKALGGTFPPTTEIQDPMGPDPVAVWSGGDFILRFQGLEEYRASTFPLRITFLGCTERICLMPYTQTLEIPVFGDGGKAAGTAPGGDSPPAEKTSPGAGLAAQKTALEQDPAADDDLEQSLAAQVKQGKLQWGLLLLILFFGGMATNLTPCVFPMIPITLRILGGPDKSRFLHPLLYTAGIIITYTLLGSVASLSGGVFGAVMGSPGFNLFFAFVFVVFGVSMLGFGNFSKLQNLGTRLGSGPASPGNTLLMGAGAGLVAAPCTGPILGALLAYTAKNSASHEAVSLFFVYSLGFALPYLFLGMAAGKISMVKISGNVQSGVKLVFAAVMFALALYYLRIPLRSLVQMVAGYWQMLALSITGAGVLAMLYFTRSRWAGSKTAALAPCAVLAVGLFAGSQWLTGGDVKSDIPLTWHKTMEEGIAVATRENKPLFVDGWAEWCEACKKMDVTTFQDPQLRMVLKKNWVLVKLDFTELTPEQEILAEKYGMQGLPAAVLLPPDGDVTKIRSILGWASAGTILKELNLYQGH